MRVRCSLMFLQAAIYCVVVFLLRNTRHVTFTNVLYLFFAPLTSRGRSLQLAFVFYLRVEVPIGCLWLWTNDYILLRDSYLSPCCPSRIVGRGCFFVRVKKETRDYQVRFRIIGDLCDYCFYGITCPQKLQSIAQFGIFASFLRP